MRPFRLGAGDTRKALLLLDPDDPEAEQKIRRKLERSSADEIAEGFREIARKLEKWVNGWHGDPVDAMRQEMDAINVGLRDHRKLTDAVTRTVVNGADLGVQIAVRQLGTVGFGFDYTLVNTRARDWAREYAGELIKGIDSTTQDVVREALGRWVENAEPLQALIDDLTPAFGPERAERVATTEVTRAFAEGNKRIYEESGVVETWQWQTSQDEIVAQCPICFPMQGEETPVGEDWIHPETGEAISIPGHVNCRCWAVAVIPGRGR